MKVRQDVKGCNQVHSPAGFAPPIYGSEDDPGQSPKSTETRVTSKFIPLEALDWVVDSKNQRLSAILNTVVNK